MTLGGFKRWLPHLVALLLVGFGAWYVISHRDDFAILGRLDLRDLLWVALAFMVCCIIGGFQFNLFLRRYGVRLPWYRWLGLYLLMSVGNIVSPLRGGTGICAVYLKAEHGFDFKRFGMLLLGSHILSALVNASVAIVGLTAVVITEHWVSVPLYVASGAVLLVCLATFLVPRLPESPRWGWTYVVRAVNGWKALFADRSLLWKVLLAALLQTLAQTAMHLLVYRSLGVIVPPVVMLTVVSLSIIAAMISLTPGSLGPYDAALVALPTVYGLTLQQTASALIVFRGTAFVTAFVLAGLFWIAIGRHRPPATEDAAGPMA